MNVTVLASRFSFAKSIKISDTSLNKDVKNSFCMCYTSIFPCQKISSHLFWMVLFMGKHSWMPFKASLYLFLWRQKYFSSIMGDPGTDEKAYPPRQNLFIGRHPPQSKISLCVFSLSMKSSPLKVGNHQQISLPQHCTPAGNNRFGISLNHHDQGSLG